MEPRYIYHGFHSYMQSKCQHAWAPFKVKSSMCKERKILLQNLHQPLSPPHMSSISVSMLEPLSKSNHQCRRGGKSHYISTPTSTSTPFIIYKKTMFFHSLIVFCILGSIDQKNGVVFLCFNSARISFGLGLMNSKVGT